MFDFDLPKIDLVAEVEGKWYPYRGEISFRIARMNNAKYLEAVAELSNHEHDEASPKDKKAMAAEVWARTILKDWRGVMEKGGEEIPYSYAAGAQLLADDHYKEIANFILRKAKSSSENWELEAEETGNE